MHRLFGTALLAVATGAAVLLGVPRAPTVQAQEPDEVHIRAPEFPTGQKWLNSSPLTLQKLHGKVVLVDFWEYTCVNCIRTFPYLKSWNDKYKDKGLVIVGVHTPEFAFAKEQDNVTKAVKKFGLSYPHIVDSNYDVWKAYGNRFWPAKYLIDKDGFVRYFHFGEGGYGDTEAKLQKLLREADPDVKLPPIGDVVRDTDRPGAVCYPVTPELYLGFERGRLAGTLGNREGFQPGQTVSYRDPGHWQDGLYYAAGTWKDTPEALVSTRDAPNATDYIAIRYHALEVNSVLKPEEGKPVQVWVYHDGRPVAQKDKGDDIKYDSQGRSYIIVDEPRMYHLIKNDVFGQRNLKLAPTTSGMGIYSFTFVSCGILKRR